MASMDVFTSVTIPSVRLALSDLDHFKRPLSKVYLGSPLTGVPLNAVRYTEKCRKIIKSVLNSSVNFGHFWVYDPSEYTAPGSNHTSDEIVCHNRAEVLTSQLLVICQTYPSNGMGFEQDWARNLKIPTVIIHPAKTKLSRMVTPSNLEIEPITFLNLADLRYKFQSGLKLISKAVVSGVVGYRKTCEVIDPYNGRAIITRNRIRAKMTRQDVESRCNLVPGMLARIEIVDQVYLSLNQIELATIFSTLQCATRSDYAHKTEYVDSAVDDVPESFRASMMESLDQLVAFVHSRTSLNDGKIIRIWEQYQESIAYGLKGREELNRVLKIDDWEKLYSARLF